MPVFRSKAPTWNTYLAGIGATGVLMASAFAVFVILVGLVTFDAWPHAGSLFGGGGDVALNGTATNGRASVPAPPGTVNLVNLLGGGANSALQPAGGRGHAPGGTAHGGIPGVNPSGGSGGGSGGAGSPGQGPRGPSSGTPRNAVNQVVSGAGNTVQNGTETLGNALGGSGGPGLGGVVGGVGRTVNDDLQSLAGRR